jgi:hypothetical protein
MKSTLSVSYQGRADDAKDATIVAVVTQANGEEYGAGFDSTTMERDLQFRVPSDQLDAIITTLIQQIAGLSIAGLTVQTKKESHDSTISAFDTV